ncbi:uncharacterized protein A4U43_C08F21570 [Asparagus officinalis]|nr:uncharacterized protein A4U43_C08F21570 [Asparagus officinalis]
MDVKAKSKANVLNRLKDLKVELGLLDIGKVSGTAPNKLNKNKSLILALKSPPTYFSLPSTPLLEMDVKAKSKANVLNRLKDLKVELGLLDIGKVSGTAPNKLNK